MPGLSHISRRTTIRGEEDTRRGGWGEGFYKALRFLSRTYLDFQQLRMACEARIRSLSREGVPDWALELLREYSKRLRGEERWILERVKEVVKDHPIWEYCTRIKGMGPVAALTFTGYINVFHCDTAGKAKAYLNMTPDYKRRPGQRIRGNPEASGRIWVVTRGVVMHRDPFYYPLYQEKKRYYMENSRKVWYRGEWVDWPPFKDIIENPKLCPRYEECREMRAKKARRLGRRPKPPACRKHVDLMAKRWLAGLIISHATEILRRAEGLSVENFKKHRGYIPPPI